ncbi:hypothetical protein [Puniceibacterium sp. IMCC21224]|uniref:hypothetical protein n=1 Tax=Puniceibacterium sp. IMCC21224 TaxID=1618204 RepID=UPI00064D9A7A|nr:hypothetical protein [Puniceibacterium sp. IMCC21224]KMK67607.1 hypothetical protein IMCC21224_112478 [Puniceibacterium sp. IMCC21224]
MTRPVNAYAALIMPDSTDLEPGKYLEIARDVLATLDCPRGDPPLVSSRRCHTAGETLDLAVRVELDQPDRPPRIVIEARAFRDAAYSDEHGAQVLSDIVLAAFALCNAELVEWDNRDVRLDRGEFIALRRYVSPRRTPVVALVTPPVVPQTASNMQPLHQKPSWGYAKDKIPQIAEAPRRATILSAPRDQQMDDDLERRLIRRFCIELAEEPPASVIERSQPTPSKARVARTAVADSADHFVADTDSTIPREAQTNDRAARRPMLASTLTDVARKVIETYLPHIRLRFAAQVASIAMLFVMLQTTNSLGSVLALVLP